MMRWPETRMRMVRPIDAAAPSANTAPRMAAAAGIEMGSTVAVEPEKRSMMRPIVNGIESEIDDETNSSPTATAIVLRSGLASSTSPAAQVLHQLVRLLGRISPSLRMTSPILIFSFTVLSLTTTGSSAFTSTTSCGFAAASVDLKRAWHAARGIVLPKRRASPSSGRDRAAVHGASRRAGSKCREVDETSEWVVRAEGRGRDGSAASGAVREAAASLSRAAGTTRAVAIQGRRGCWACTCGSSSQSTVVWSLRIDR